MPEGKPTDSEVERAPSKRAFLLRRLHSLSGVLPVGVFLVVHLWTNASLLGGREPFDHAVEDIQRLPFLPLVEVAGVVAPLAFHALFGVYLATLGRPNAARYGHGRNWAYVFQRITGAIAFVFVLAHLWELRVQKWLFGMSHTAFYDTLVSHLSSVQLGLPLMAVFYLVGIAASVFHLANGLATFTMTWGIVTSRRAQGRVAIAASIFGVLLFAVGASTVVSVTTGAQIESAHTPSAPCPPSSAR